MRFVNPTPLLGGLICDYYYGMSLRFLADPSFYFGEIVTKKRYICTKAPTVMSRDTAAATDQACSFQSLISLG